MKNVFSHRRAYAFACQHHCRCAGRGAWRMACHTPCGHGFHNSAPSDFHPRSGSGGKGKVAPWAYGAWMWSICSRRRSALCPDCITRSRDATTPTTEVMPCASPMPAYARTILRCPCVCVGGLPTASRLPRAFGRHTFFSANSKLTVHSPGEDAGKIDTDIVGLCHRMDFAVPFEAYLCLGENGVWRGLQSQHQQVPSPHSGGEPCAQLRFPRHHRLSLRVVKKCGCRLTAANALPDAQLSDFQRCFTQYKNKASLCCKEALFAS